MRLFIIAVLVLCASVVYAQEKKVFPADKGPATVDVSTYPQNIQMAYLDFAGKCAKCHTLARPINTNFSAKEWKMYVKRMINKPDSGIKRRDGKKIYKFLKFYQAEKDAKKAN